MKLTLQNLSIFLLASLPLSTAILPIELCPSCPKPEHCSNQGWDWAYYSNPLRNDGENYPGFRADVYKTRNPVYSGVTPWIGGQLGYTDANPDTSTFYGSPVELNSTYFALNHHAYLYACEGGTWQFDITHVDDVVFAWIGEAAVSGWTDANADAKAVWTFVGNDYHYGSASVRKDLEGNRFHPLRFVFADGQWGGVFNLTITSPSGIIVHQSGRDSDWIVRYSCGFDTSAPRFPDFGSES
ncbi:GLEYA domain-containing protein [Daldinia loculata]|uniref:GLEYA domain-containing protein n=1 Tax=Daldinia loculata TaxID=103429 RepID=UPI0020C44BE3|nr:GLEYA domain-containing protein [Daldinia loculata]KAI1641779.1 GLEYA domain-containing protein [Daldinia loculata]